MGIFTDQVGRLRRERWSDINVFADELIALLSSDAPIRIDSPVEITNTTEESPLTIRNYGNSDNDIAIERHPEPPGDFPDYPPREVPDFGIDPGEMGYVDINPDGVTTGTAPAGDPSNRTPATKVTLQGGGGLPGKVTGGGPGELYDVDVYEQGLEQAPVSRKVKQLQIDKEEQIPEGTWALVGKVGESYFMQVAVYLAGPPS